MRSSRHQRRPFPGFRISSDCGLGARGFTLIELLAVVGILVLLMGLAIPAVVSLGKSDNLNTSARIVGDLVTVARSQAINGNAHVQLRVVTDKWQAAAGDDADAHYRKISLWQCGSTQTEFNQLTSWETLPAGITLDPSADPSTKAAYHFPSADPPGIYLLSATLSNTLTDVATGPATADLAYLEFAPDGSVCYNASVTTLPGQVYLLLVDASQVNAGAPNWAQVRAASLTGRVSVVRP